MDISAFYQLKDRLYASVAAGCGTIKEDFRLKRAIEAFEPLAKANKVFKKLYDMCVGLIDSEKPSEIIVDCIALADALAVTQGTFAEKAITHKQTDSINSQPAYIYSSVLSNRISELQNNTVVSINKSIAFDPRFINAFIKKIGTNSVNFEKCAETLLKNYYGESIIPILKELVKEQFSNPKANGKAVDYIALIAKEKENDFYIDIAFDENAPQTVRASAIKAMAFQPQNAETLEQIYNTQKGNAKKSALMSLAKIGGEIAERNLQKICQKFAKTNAEIIAISNGETCTKFVKDYISQKLDGKISPEEQELIVTMLANKKGLESEILAVARVFLDYKIIDLNDMLVENVINNDDEYYKQLIKNLYKKLPEFFGNAYFWLSVVLTDEEFSTETAHNINKIVNANREYYLRVISRLRYFSLEDTFKICADNYGNSMIDGLPVTQKQILRLLNIAGDVSYLEQAKTIKRKSAVENEIVSCIDISCYIFDRLYNQTAFSVDVLKIVRQKAMDFVTWCVDNYPTAESIVSFNNMTNGKASEQRPHILENYIDFYIKYKSRAVHFSNLRLVPEDILIKELPQVIQKYSDEYEKNKSILIGTQLKELNRMKKALGL